MKRKIAMPVPSKEKIVKYKVYDQETDKYITGSTNQLTWQLMKRVGLKKHLTMVYLV